MMGFHQKEEYNDLALEPMEGLAEKSLFGDFSSRDTKQQEKALTPTAAEPGKQVDGKANFYTEDRQLGERRFGQRRRMVRLTGDRRSGQSRREKSELWEFASSS